MTVGITEMLQWCAVKWDSQDMVSHPFLCASQLNRYFSCAGAVAVDGSSLTGSTFSQFVSSVDCVGGESDLLSCPLNSSAVVCAGEAKAGVACQG